MPDEFPLLLGWASVSLYQAGATDLNTEYAWRNVKAEVLQMSQQFQVIDRRPTGALTPKFRSIPNGYSIQWDRLLLLPKSTFNDVSIGAGSRWVLDAVWVVDDIGHAMHGRWHRRLFTGVVLDGDQITSREVFEHHRSNTMRAESCQVTGGISGEPPSLTTPLAL